MALSPRTLPRPISRRAEADQSARPLQALIAFFTQILCRGIAPSKKRADRRHEAWLSCSGGRVARNSFNCASDSPRDESVRRRTRLPLQLLQFLIYFVEGLNREFQVFAGMRGGDLRADACGAMWNNRIKEADHVNAFV